jgi:hypothetical protein
MQSTSNGNSEPHRRPVFVFDADFPQGIAQQLLDEWTPSIDLISWDRIIKSVKGVSDEDFIVNAWQKNCDGVVSCNHFMLDVPETLAIIRQTGMTIVACHGKTNKTQFATGVLFVNLENVARNFIPDRPQVWELKEPMRSPMKFEQHLRQVERNCHCDIGQYERSAADLAKPLFPWP